MGLTVLVVDDEQKLRELLRSYLEREGLGVAATGSGAANRTNRPNTDHSNQLRVRKVNPAPYSLTVLGPGRVRYHCLRPITTVFMPRSVRKVMRSGAGARRRLTRAGRGS
jgi:hypothetical protein